MFCFDVLNTLAFCFFFFLTYQPPYSDKATLQVLLFYVYFTTHCIEIQSEQSAFGTLNSPAPHS